MMKRIIISMLVLLPLVLMAQNPKMHIRAYGGVHDHYFVYRGQEKITDHLVGYMFGAGFRVTYKKIYGEIDFDFVRTGVLFQFDSIGVPGLDNEIVEFRFNAFELPITGGYVPVKTPFFKWYIYTGPVQRLNTKGKIKFLGEEEKFKPREVGLPFYNLDWRFGTQFDIAFFNVDVRYSVGVTNSAKENVRTNSHEFSLVFGLIF